MCDYAVPCIVARSMTSPHTSTEDYLVQQENELEALSSIFGDDFKDLRRNDTWKVFKTHTHI